MHKKLEDFHKMEEDAEMKFQEFWLYPCTKRDSSTVEHNKYESIHQFNLNS